MNKNKLDAVGMGRVQRAEAFLSLLLADHRGSFSAEEQQVLDKAKMILQRVRSET